MMNSDLKFGNTMLTLKFNQNKFVTSFTSDYCSYKIEYKNLVESLKTLYYKEQLSRNKHSVFSFQGKSILGFNVSHISLIGK